jgi:hypothetical protein
MRKTTWKRTLIIAVAAALLLPLAIHAQGAVFVKNDNLGVGNSDPVEDIDVLSTDGDAQILVRETGTPVVQRGLMFLRNNGGVSFVMRNDSTSQSWSFGAGAADFLINQQQSSGIELRLTPDGVLTIEGTLNTGSSRTIKNNIVPVDGTKALEEVLKLPVATWTYLNDTAPHMGPMAEDFRAAFGLGDSDRYLAPADVAGVALAAIQGLNTDIEEKDARIADLESRLENLEALIASLTNH